MAGKERPQAGLEDRIVHNEELEKMLDDRQDLKESVKEHNKLTKDIKDMLKRIEEPMPFRIGRFVIDGHTSEGHHIEFDTQASFRFSIKLAGEE